MHTILTAALQKYARFGRRFLLSRHRFRGLPIFTRNPPDREMFAPLTATRGALKAFGFCFQPVLGVNAPSSALLYVILSPVGPYFQTMKALTLLAEPNYVRAWPGGSGSTKVGANYGPTIYVQVKPSLNHPPPPSPYQLIKC